MIPVIGGEPVVGATLTASNAAWPDAVDLGFTWTVDDVVQLRGQGADTFLLAASFADRHVRVSVEAVDGAGASSGPVTVRAGTITTPGRTTITGKAVVGQVLTASAGTITPAGHTLAYQWYRGSAAIRAAAGSRYAIAAADVGKTVAARITVTAAGFTTVTLTSNAVTAAAAAITRSPVPRITGSAKVGSRLSAVAGTWSPYRATLTYQWYRGSHLITGARGWTHTVAAAGKGQRIKVRVRAVKPGYTTIDRWSASRTIAPGSIIATRKPAVAGTARYGSTVKISQRWTAGARATYQWYRNGKAVKGAQRPTLRLSAGYIGSKVTAKVTVSKPGYTTRRATTRAIAVGNALLTVKSAPKITGTKKSGSYLSAVVGSFSPRPTSYGYRWYRNGSGISGANHRTYRLTTADNGKRITVRLCAHRTHYNTRSALSNSALTSAPPRVVIGADGRYRIGTHLRPGLYKATGRGSGRYWETVSNFSGKFSAINGNYFGSARTYVRIGSGDVGFSTADCGKWTTVSATGARASTISADGTYRVDIDIKPGTYAGSGSGSGCYWAVLRDFRGSFDDIIDNYYGADRTVLTIPAAAKGFEVSGCGSLKRL